MTVGALIEKLKAFPQDQRVVIYPDEGWSDIKDVVQVFGDFVALRSPDDFIAEEE